MTQHEQIWNLAKFRFVQSEASLWVISNKVLEVAWFLGISCWIYYEFFSFNYTYLKFIGLIIIYLSVGEIRLELDHIEDILMAMKKASKTRRPEIVIIGEKLMMNTMIK